MLKKFAKRTLLITFFLCLVFLMGCGDKKKALTCPFSEITWETSPEKLITSEGECMEPYDSVYGGSTYTYEGTYKERKGTIKYMYNEKDELISIAFAYGSTDADELKVFYDEIVKDMEKEYGESDYDANEETNYGKRWTRDDGRILLSVMLTGSNKALQLAFINPIYEATAQ